MADTLTYDPTEDNAPELNEEEQNSLEVGEKLAEQEEQLEEMKKAVYDRFNKRFSVIVGN